MTYHMVTSLLNNHPASVGFLGMGESLYWQPATEASDSNIIPTYLESARIRQPHIVDTPIQSKRKLLN